MNRITFPLPSELPGASYSDLHDALRHLLDSDLLPLSLADRAAMFPKLEADRAANNYGDATRSLVTAFQLSAQLRETGEVDELTAEKMNSRLAELGLLLLSTLRCTVTCKQRTLAGVAVRVFERDFGQTRTPLTHEAITDQFGQVTVYYFTQVLTSPSSGIEIDPTIVIELAYDQNPIRGFNVQRNGSRDAVAISEAEIGFASRRNEALDIDIPASSIPSLTDFQRLQSSLTGVLPNSIPISKLVGQDIALASNRTKWSEAQVAAIQVAESVAESEPLESRQRFSEALFGALSVLGYSLIENFATVSIGSLVRAIEKAVGEQLISVAARISPEELATAIRRRGIDAYLDKTLVAGTSPLRQILEIALLDRKMHVPLYELFADYSGTMAGFWVQLRPRLTDPDWIGTNVDQLAYVLSLAEITGNNASLVRAIIAEFPPVGTAEELSAILDTDRLVPLLTNEMPKDVSGASDVERRRAYAQQIIERLDASYPDSKFFRLASHVAEQTSNAILKAALNELRSQSVRSNVISEETGGDANGTTQIRTATEVRTDNEAVQGQMRRLKELSAVAGRQLFRLNLLADDRFQEASDVLTITQKSFVTSFDDSGDDKKTAEEVYGRAQRAAAIAQLLNLDRREMSNREAVLQNPRRLRPSVSWEELFGPAGSCACEGCNSILSPAAYFANLLDFLHKRHIRTDGKAEIVPGEVLLRHRPDLKHLDLSCSNTNTEIPYLDLAIEIMEQVVAYKAIQDGSTVFIVSNLKPGLPDHSGGLATVEGISIQTASKTGNVVTITTAVPHGRTVGQLVTVEGVNENRYNGIFAIVEVPNDVALTYFNPTEELPVSAGGTAVPTAKIEFVTEIGNRVRVTSGTPHGFAVGQTVTISGVPEPNYNGSFPILSTPTFNTYEESAKELEAYPHHVNEVVYSAPGFLSSAVYPISLPYNRWQQLESEYLKVAGLSVADLEFAATELNPDTHPQSFKLASLFLGIDEPEFELLTGKDWANQSSSALVPTHTLYGLESAVAPFGSATELDSVRKICDRLSLNFEQVKFVLRTRTINLPPETSVQSEGADACDTANMQLRRDGKPLKEVDFRRLHLFVRLWRRFAWTADELAIGLWTFADDLIDNTFLPNTIAQLAAAEGLRRASGIGVAGLLAQWQPRLDSFGPSAIYRQLWLNPQLNPEPGAFELLASLAGEFDELVRAGDDLRKHQPAICAVLKVRSSEFQTICEIANSSKATRLADAVDPPKLTLKNLSSLYRIVFLARLSQTRFTDLRLLWDRLATLEAEHPVSSPKATIAFLENVAALRQSDLSVSQAVYLCGDRTVENTVDFQAPQSHVALLTHALTDTRKQIEAELPALVSDLGPVTHSSPATLGRLLNESYTDSHAFLISIPDATLDDQIEFKIGPAKWSYIWIAGSNIDSLLESLRKQFPSVKWDLLKDAKSVAARLPRDTPVTASRTNHSTHTVEALVISQLLLPEVAGIVVSGLQPVGSIGVFVFDYLLQQLKSDKIVGSEHFKTTFLHVIDLRLIAWGDGIAVPTLGNNLVVAGTDDTGILHVRIFNSVGDYTDTDESSLNSQANTIANLKQQLSGLLPPHKLTDAERAEVFGEIASILGQTLLRDSNHRDQESQARIDQVHNTLVGQLSKSRLNFAFDRLLRAELNGNGALLKAIQDSYSDRIDAVYGYLGLDASKTTAFVQYWIAAAMVTNKLRLSDTEFKYLFGTAGSQQFSLELPSPIDLDKVQQRLQRLVEIVSLWALSRRLPKTTLKLMHVLTKQDEGLTRQFLGEVSGTNVAVTDWADQFLKALPMSSKFTEQNAFALEKCLTIFRKGVISPQDLVGIVSSSVSKARSELVRGFVQARYSATSWLEATKQVHDRVRESSRDALISFILNMPEIKSSNVRSANDLFDLLLIDPEMGASMKTSRLSQAITSVQLFVQRCLLNLEEEVPPNAIDLKNWELLEYFGVVTAQKRIVLFPELWLDSANRDNKSEPFIEIESQWQKGGLTAEKAESSFADYVYSLNEVANLEICGLHWADESQTLHVFGRTSSLPRVYYYRRRESQEWTPWNKVGVDIEGVERKQPSLVSGLTLLPSMSSSPELKPGVQLAPVVFKGKLYLFWLSLSSSPSFDDKSFKIPRQDEDYKLTAPKEVFWYRLAWAQYSNGVWSPRQLADESTSADSLFISGLATTLSPANLQLRVEAFPDRLHLDIHKVLPEDADAEEEDTGMNGLDQSRYIFNEFGVQLVRPSKTIARNPFKADGMKVLYSGFDLSGAATFSTAYSLSGSDRLLTMKASEQAVLTRTCEYFLVDIRVQGREDTYFLSDEFDGNGNKFVAYRDTRGTYFIEAEVPNSPSTVSIKTFHHPVVGEFSRRIGSGAASVLKLDSQSLGNPYLTTKWTRSNREIPAGFEHFSFMYSDRPDLISALGVSESAGFVMFRRANTEPSSSWEPTGTVNPGDPNNRPLNIKSFKDSVAVIETEFGLWLFEFSPDATATDQPIRFRSFPLPVTTLDGGVTYLRKTNSAYSVSESRIQVNVRSGSNWTPTEAFQLETQLRKPKGICAEEMSTSGGSVIHLLVLDERSINADHIPLHDLIHFRIDTKGEGKLTRLGCISRRATGPASLLVNRALSGPMGGNLEAVVAEGKVLRHYYFNPSDEDRGWRRAQVVTKGIADVTTPISICQTNVSPNSSISISVLRVLGRVDDHFLEVSHNPSGEFYFQTEYFPEAANVRGPYPTHDVDFQNDGAYACYNWELFFHLPTFFATSLSKNQKFSEAREWFHKVFDPTDDSDETSPERFWKLLPFREWTAANGQIDLTDVDWLNQPFQPHRIARHRISAYMKWIVMKYVDNLLDWGDWHYRRADAMGSVQEVNLAEQLYLLSAKILGTRPERNNPAKPKVVQTYASLQRKETAVSLRVGRATMSELLDRSRLDPDDTTVSTLLSLDYEGYFCTPENTEVLAYWDRVDDRLFKIRHSMNIDGVARRLPLFEPAIDPALLIEAAAAGLEIDDILADIYAPLPLYRFSFMLQKAIELCNDVKALGAALLSAIEKQDVETLSLLRAQHELAVVTEMEETKKWQIREALESLNGLLVSRSMAHHRLEHFALNLGENRIGEQRFGGTSVTIPPAPGLPNTTDVPEVPNFEYYADRQRDPNPNFRVTDQDALGSIEVGGRALGEQVGREVGNIAVTAVTAPIGVGIASGVAEGVSSALGPVGLVGGFALKGVIEDGINAVVDEVVSPVRDAVQDVFGGIGAMVGALALEAPKFENTVPLAGTGVLNYENQELKCSHDATANTMNASMAEKLAGFLGAFPMFSIDIKPFGLGGGTSLGGTQLASTAIASARQFSMLATWQNFQASIAAKMASYLWRERDFTLQRNLASREIAQIDRQIVAAKIRRKITERDLENHRSQIKRSQEVEQYLRTKYTNADLYVFFEGKVADLYFKSYQMAIDFAKRVERCYQFELGEKSTSFIKANQAYWDSRKSGFLAGENLHFSLKQMEQAYQEKNHREAEITKHISLAQLDTLALIRLQNLGESGFEIPEVVFDLDFPGHYFRRIKSVSITIPCVAGPYTSVSGRLTLVNSRIRTHAEPQGDYAETDPWNDLRFTYFFPGQTSIATSHGQNDSGMFELNFRDERYLPFEGAGAVSTWNLKLPGEFRNFDYKTISDVIIHIKYTAREGSLTLSQAANDAIAAQLNAMAETNSGLFARVFRAKHDFAPNWSRFQSGTDKLSLPLSEAMQPFAGRTSVPPNFVRLSLWAIARGKADLSTIGVLIPKDSGQGSDSVQFAQVESQVFEAIIRGDTPSAENSIDTDLIIAPKIKNYELTIATDGLAKADIEDILVVCVFNATKPTEIQ